jgi:hypothetical protein
MARLSRGRRARRTQQRRGVGKNMPPLFRGKRRRVCKHHWRRCRRPRRAFRSAGHAGRGGNSEPCVFLPASAAGSGSARGPRECSKFINCRFMRGPLSARTISRILGERSTHSERDQAHGYWTMRELLSARLSHASDLGQTVPMAGSSLETLGFLRGRRNWR